ncbi:carboxypeptidase-like regulatory domain-containing protein [Desulfosediminicola flagellatus]|uniref:carboxypeptidase-like regulatory domain-containing protein n=1 Tax=Desulfosediminicola flagellatus TaxID=2569541 RepID=UPI0010AC5D03|nr:carboxypeptidase-like regulatory domain-containing protein [Desulfosediminicola flagellatus]
MVRLGFIVVLLFFVLNGGGLGIPNVQASSESYTVDSLDVITRHWSRNGVSTSTSFAFISKVRSASGVSVPLDTISTMVVRTPSSAECTNHSLNPYWYSRLSYTDLNGDGSIDLGESGTLNDIQGDEIDCVLPVSPHEAGEYQATFTFTNGSTYFENLSYDSPGQSISAFPPLENLAAIWLGDTGEMTLAWTLPQTYGPENSLEIRVYGEVDGRAKNKQLRILALPPNLTGFTVTQDMTDFLQVEQTDQVRVQLRMRGEDNTQSRTIGRYTYVPATRSLTEVSGIKLDGVITNSNGDAVQSGRIQLIAADDAQTVLYSVELDSTGRYSLPGVASGSYLLHVLPSTSMDNQYYLPIQVPVQIGILDMTLNYSVSMVNGNISGEVSKDLGVSNWDDLSIKILDQDFTVVGETKVRAGRYVTPTVTPGTYYLSIEDSSGLYAKKFYDEIPEWDMPNALPVAVLEGMTATDINISLHKVGDDRYHVRWPYVSTTHTLRNGISNTNSFVAYEDIYTYSDRKRILQDVISSVSVTTPSDICTNMEYDGYNFWRLNLRDQNRNGLIEEVEWDELRVIRGASAACDLNTSPHEKGDYQFTFTFEDGSVVQRTLPGEPAGLSINELPPVENLAAFWDNKNREMQLNWSLPATLIYDADDKLQVRVYSYQNGHYQNSQLRVRDLPANMTEFTLTRAMTDVFDVPDVDQLRIEIRIYSSKSSTYSSSIQTYSFDSRTGTLEEAEISATLLDINGDKKTGLEEAIYSLQAISGQ